MASPANHDAAFNEDRSGERISFEIEEVRTDTGRALRVTNPRTRSSGYIAATPALMFDDPERS